MAILEPPALWLNNERQTAAEVMSVSLITSAVFRCSGVRAFGLNCLKINAWLPCCHVTQLVELCTHVFIFFFSLLLFVACDCSKCFLALFPSLHPSLYFSALGLL